MKSFADIKYFPLTDEERNIDSLSRLYEAKNNEVETVVDTLFSTRISNEQIRAKSHC